MKRVSFILFLISVLTMLNSCRTVKQVSENSEVLSENNSQYIAIHDSIYIYRHDSIYMKITEDTVYKEVFKVFFSDKWHYDTIYRIDSVYIDRKIKEVETQIKEVNILRWWQKTLMYLGLCFVVLAGMMIYKKLK